MHTTFSQPYVSLAQLPYPFTSTLASTSLHTEDRARIAHCRDFLMAKLRDPEAIYYGINTGFGSLCDTRISPDSLETLQHNLIRSHACGAGAEIPSELVRLMLWLKVRALSLGYSGVQVELVERLLDHLAADCLPIVYELGSLGASGDLAPLAHVALPLLGEGEVRLEGKRMPAAEALSRLNWEPLTLGAKEGIALLNGTQFMLAYGIHLVQRTRRLAEVADALAALSLDVFYGKLEPFNVLLHEIRLHPGQEAVAQRVRKWLGDSSLQSSPRQHVQDPYAFRCVPQVHGASRDALTYVETVMERELNSVSDNPSIFPDENAILSGGNFHGQPLALALDFLAIAIAEWASISERRCFQLVGGQRGLPNFLTPSPGLHSGLMIPQYLAAGMVSQNKQLCTPASVDTIPSSNNQEDHVSMGANAATKCLRVLENAERVLGIELFSATQALEFRRPLRTGSRLEAWVKSYRQQVPFVESDRYFQPDLEASWKFIQAGFPMSELV